MWLMNDEERKVRLNRDEAEALARYWAGRCEDEAIFYAGSGQVGGPRCYVEMRAVTTVGTLIRVGLLTEAEWDRVREEAHAENARFWKEYEAAGCEVGFWQRMFRHPLQQGQAPTNTAAASAG
jgi:hypothetical protein